MIGIPLIGRNISDRSGFSTDKLLNNKYLVPGTYVEHAKCLFVLVVQFEVVRSPNVCYRRGAPAKFSVASL